MNATYLGLIAGAVTSAGVIPQIIKSYRTKHVRDISVWQPILLDVGMGLWLAYGIIIGDIPLILANAFSISCNSILIYMKIIYAANDKIDSSDYIGENLTLREDT